ncbi:MAG: hypothetical protein GKR99_17155 [Rhodobacteraceae bacterium]|nr:hypothetical protein [Paracoccaceae bacterium]
MVKPLIRLHLFFATQNDRAVILRQGPSKTFRLILWHRDTDTFEDGQWLKHKVYAERCDLSPDGQHFIFFALNGDWSGEAMGSYTALSRPPYFTALSLFPEGDTWGGGGRFLSNRHYVASGGADIIGRDDGLDRLFHVEQIKNELTELARVDGRRIKLSTAWQARLKAAEPVGVTHARDLYDTQGGCLFRRHGDDMTLIRDFTEMEFKAIRAPYDWRADPADMADAAPWHPLNDEAHT